MNVDDLRDLLRRMPVPEDAFVLDDDTVADEVYVLARDGLRWSVYYSERGLRTDERHFSTETEACAEMLRRLRRDNGGDARGR